jgi:hypothetical protein
MEEALKLIDPPAPLPVPLTVIEELSAIVRVPPALRLIPPPLPLAALGFTDNPETSTVRLLAAEPPAAMEICPPLPPVALIEMEFAPLRFSEPEVLKVILPPVPADPPLALSFSEPPAELLMLLAVIETVPPLVLPSAPIVIAAVLVFTIVSALRVNVPPMPEVCCGSRLFARLIVPLIGLALSVIELAEGLVAIFMEPEAVKL